MDKVMNLRDLGGIETEDKRKIKKGLFIRCASLDSASERDIERLMSMKLKSIFDFRDAAEMQDSGIYQKLNAEYNNLPIMLDSAKILNLSNNRTLRNALIPLEAEDMRIAYRSMPFNNDSIKSFVRAIREGKVPILFHCSVGKDRTGVAAAIILILLNVGREHIVKDYLESKKVVPYIVDYIAGKINILVRRVIIKRMMPVFLADETYILSALDEILSRYGSYQEYFLIEHGIGREELEEIRKRYTED